MRIWFLDSPSSLLFYWLIITLLERAQSRPARILIFAHSQPNLSTIHLTFYSVIYFTILTGQQLKHKCTISDLCLVRAHVLSICEGEGKWEGRWRSLYVSKIWVYKIRLLDTISTTMAQMHSVCISNTRPWSLTGWVTWPLSFVLVAGESSLHTRSACDNYNNYISRGFPKSNMP